jgi:hypothetical protein
MKPKSAIGPVCGNDRESEKPGQECVIRFLYIKCWSLTENLIKLRSAVIQEKVKECGDACQAGGLSPGSDFPVIPPTIGLAFLRRRMLMTSTTSEKAMAK